MGGGVVCASTFYARSRSHRVAVVEDDAETSLGFFQHGRDRVAGHRRPRGRATAAVRIPVVRRVMVTVGLVERQPASWMVMLRPGQRVMVVQLVMLLLLMVMVMVLLVVMVLRRLMMRRQRVAVRRCRAHGHHRHANAVVVERGAAAAAAADLVVMRLLIVLKVVRPAHPVRRVQIVRVRGAPALRQRHALLVAEQLPFQAVVLRLQGRDFPPVTHKRTD